MPSLCEVPRRWSVCGRTAQRAALTAPTSPPTIAPSSNHAGAEGDQAGVQVPAPAIDLRRRGLGCGPRPWSPRGCGTGRRCRTVRPGGLAVADPGPRLVRVPPVVDRAGHLRVARQRTWWPAAAATADAAAPPAAAAAADARRRTPPPPPPAPPPTPPPTPAPPHPRRARPSRRCPARRPPPPRRPPWARVARPRTRAPPCRSLRRRLRRRRARRPRPSGRPPPVAVAVAAAGAPLRRRPHLPCWRPRRSSRQPRWSSTATRAPRRPT